MKKKNSGEVYRLRWQAQEDLRYVPSCSSMSYIQKHPFTSTEIMYVLEIKALSVILPFRSLFAKVGVPLQKC